MATKINYLWAIERYDPRTRASRAEGWRIHRGPENRVSAYERKKEPAGLVKKWNKMYTIQFRVVKYFPAYW